MRKKPDPAIRAVAHRMFDEGLTVREVCERAEVSPQTWSRWASGGVPDLGKLRKIEEAVDQIVAEDALQDTDT